MSQELYYTSAPRGLKAGSRDYCTVAKTPSLSQALADELEVLTPIASCSCRATQTPKTIQSPGRTSRIRVEGEMVSVLSRICASGMDYTGRTNKFAHHVVLSDAERPKGGPAWLLSQGKLMTEEWNGHVGLLADGRILPRETPNRKSRRHGREVMGDAGWAGVLAETFIADPKRLVYLVFQPGITFCPCLPRPRPPAARGTMENRLQLVLQRACHRASVAPGSESWPTLPNSPKCSVSRSR